MNPLGLVKQIVEEAGMGISYVYEDLVFLEHNSYLIQFTDSPQEIVVHQNSEADESIVSEDVSRLQEFAKGHQMRIVVGTSYTLNQDDEEHIRIDFQQAV